MSSTSVINNLGVTQSSDTVSPVVQDLVTTIKSIVKELKDIQNNKDHWKKQEFDAALVCGENLSKLRSTFGENGHGFKSLVETTFVNEFSYKTSLRYMKLFTKKNELSSDINSLRKAYIKLNIIPEDNYLYPKNKVVTPEVSSVVEKEVTVNPVSTKSVSKVMGKKGAKQSVIPYTTGIILCNKMSYIPTDGYFVREFLINKENILTCRNTNDVHEHDVVSETGINVFYQALTPFIAWYCEQANKRNPIIQLMRSETVALSIAA